MKDYPYLSDTKKAHSVSYLLMGACALFSLLALFAKTNKFLLWIACILAITMYCFAMHYLDYHNVQGQSIKKYIFAFHCFAIHALLMMFAEIANGPGIDVPYEAPELRLTSHDAPAEALADRVLHLLQLGRTLKVTDN